jgi:deoxyribodipyrimidine photo-lyase
MSIVWIRNDLRLADNPALASASEAGPVVPVSLWEPDEEYPWEPGAASRWWLHHSLSALGTLLAAMGSRLVLRTGPTLKVLRSLVAETGSDAVYWNNRYEPAVVARDKEIQRSLEAAGIRVVTFDGALLRAPEDVRTKQDKPYRVFTPYWNACKDRDVEPPMPAPASLAPPPKLPTRLKRGPTHSSPVNRAEGVVRPAPSGVASQPRSRGLGV